MATFLQPVELPQRCYLYEVLLWVAFQRLPIASYNWDGIEVREDSEHEGYEPSEPERVIYDEECKRAGIPPDPRYTALVTEGPLLTFRQLEPKVGADEALRLVQEASKREEERLETAYAEWEPHYRAAIEYPASQIFVALKSGQLRARGRRLPALDKAAALAQLKEKELYIGDLDEQEIAVSFWTLREIDFESSAARNAEDHYCQISFRTEDVLSCFPGEREPVAGIERVGDSFVINDKLRKPTSVSKRGRPAYPWEPFHLEVAALIQKGELPLKKEAAIQHFQSWFESQLGVEPSRAAIGEKLKPYYDKFGNRGGQKMPG
jgi:hypothetical protein